MYAIILGLYDERYAQKRLLSVPTLWYPVWLATAWPNTALIT